MTSKTSLQQAILAALHLDTDKPDVDAAAVVIADIFVAFASEIWKARPMPEATTSVLPPQSHSGFGCTPVVPDESYFRDDYSRAGCQVVINFSADKYQMSVYSPPFLPDGKRRFLEGHAARKIAGLGIALDAFACGKDIRSVFPEVESAERAAASAAAQSSVSTSKVTL